MKSLRARMLWVMGACIACCWIAVLALTLSYTARSEDTIWDTELQDIGTRVLLSMPAGMSKLDAVDPTLPQRHAKPSWDSDTTFQIWSNRSRQVVRSPDAPLTPLRPDFIDGFSNTIINGEKWRVFSLADSSGAIHAQVGNLQSAIDAQVRHKVIGLLGVTTFLLLLGGVLMAWAVRRALNPVVAIGAALRTRRKFDLTPLPLAQLPSELHPLVESFNHLLDQVGQAVDSERRFIDDAAHELRTPLAALQAHGQVALRAATLEEKDAALVKLLAVAERSTRLSDQLLDLARLDAGLHTPHEVLADLSELLVHVVREFDISAQQNRRVLLLAAEPCHIECDVDEIGILLRNLIDNALRHTFDGGRVRIGCGAHGGSAYLEVADDGPGVPPAEWLAIFGRFHRVAGNVGRGSGIGLSLVAGIAQLHRATIQPGIGLDGRGFSVRVTFPAPDRQPVW